MKTHPDLFASFSTSGDAAIASALVEPVILAVMVVIGSRGTGIAEAALLSLAVILPLVQAFYRLKALAYLRKMALTHSRGTWTTPGGETGRCIAVAWCGTWLTLEFDNGSKADFPLEALVRNDTGTSGWTRVDGTGTHIVAAALVLVSAIILAGGLLRFTGGSGAGMPWLYFWTAFAAAAITLDNSLISRKSTDPGTLDLLRQYSRSKWKTPDGKVGTTRWAWNPCDDQIPDEVHIVRLAFEDGSVGEFENAALSPA